MGTYDGRKIYLPAADEQGWGDEMNANLSRLGDLAVNVKAFGALGDATTDDTTAIQAAINYASGTRYSGSIFFPPGEYVVTSTLSVPVGALHPYMSFIGGHNSSGFIRGQRPPAVWIDGTAITNAPVFDVSTGNTTFENLMVKGGHQAFRFYESGSSVANINFYNCSAEVLVSGNADNTAVFMENTFWSHFKDSSFVAADPAIIMRGTTSDDLASCTNIQFDHCQWWDGGIHFEQNALGAATWGNIQFRDCVTESSNGWALLHIAQGPAIADTWFFGGLVMDWVQSADATAEAPLVELDAANCYLVLPYFRNVWGSGSRALVVTSGTITSPHVTQTIGSGSAPLVVDGSDNLLAAVVDKQSGTDYRGTEEIPLTTDLTSSHGAMLRFAQSGDAYARAGIDSTGKHYWGPGGATGTGYDTTLERSAANVLAIGADDALKTGAAVHASLPVATGYAAGSQFYCTTDKQPLWSDGAVWVEADGTNH